MLQLITHRDSRLDDLKLAELALQGGCKWIQLRLKNSAKEEIREIGKEFVKLCRQYNATAILDDHVALSVELGFDGVHLGKRDMSPVDARNWVPEGYLIGGTANTLEDMERLVAQGVDYIGLGPYRFTETKSGLSPILGLEGVQTIVSAFRRAGFTIPIIAIGGVQEEDIPALMKTGINGIALSGAILKAEDPLSKTKGIISLIDGHV